MPTSDLLHRCCATCSQAAGTSWTDVEDLSDEELTRLKEAFARMGDHPDDPVRRQLKKALGRSRGHGHAVDGAHRKAPPAVQMPPRKERQHEEYTLPLRASQRQWT